ncbi:MAG: hypothetical protein HY688_04105, partial [Chloroflexi bacterium]|nr:hypothetical protein [Chloroflexota bacterium]
ATISAAEGFSLAPETLQIVVRAASGSLRDAENLLEQLVLTAGPQATAEDAQALFGVAGSLRARGLVAALLVQGDLAAALTGLARLQTEGVDMRQVHRELVEELRTLLLRRAGAGDVLDLSPEERAEGRETARRMDLGTIHRALEALALLALPPGSPPLPLELAFTQIAIQSRQVETAGTAPVRGATEGPAAPPPAPPRSSEPAPRSASPARRPRAAAPPLEPPPSAQPVPPAPETPPAVPASDRPAGPVTIEEVRARWREIVDGMRGLGSSGNLDAFLRSVSQPLAIEDGTLVIGFYHEFHRAKIADPKYRHLVERRIAQILGRAYALRCEHIERPPSGGHLVKAALERGAQRVETGDEGEPT